MATPEAPKFKPVAITAYTVVGFKCGVCNDKVMKYWDHYSELTDSWFCNDPKCIHGIFNRDRSEKRPDWLVASKQNVDIKEVASDKSSK